MKKRNIERQNSETWATDDEVSLKYHIIQWGQPKRSTLAFEKFINPTLQNQKNIIDLGAGVGGATAYLAINNPSINFTALDYSKSLIELGNKIKSKKSLNNLEFEQGDWHNLKKKEI